jgi:hypothetical protein
MKSVLNTPEKRGLGDVSLKSFLWISNKQRSPAAELLCGKKEIEKKKAEYIRLRGHVCMTSGPKSPLQTSHHIVFRRNESTG